MVLVMPTLAVVRDWLKLIVTSRTNQGLPVLRPAAAVSDMVFTAMLVRLTSLNWSGALSASGQKLPPLYLCFLQLLLVVPDG